MPVSAAATETEISSVDAQIRQARMQRYSNPQLARTLIDKAYASACELDYEIGVANALLTQGNLTSDEGAFKTSALRLSEAREIFSRLNDMSGICDSLCALANVKHRMHEYTEALALADESLDLARKLDHPLREADVYGLQGSIAFILGDNHIALDYLEQSEALFKKHADVPGLRIIGIGRVYSLRAFIYQLSNQFDKALDYLNAALEEFQNNAGHSAIAGGLINIGVNHAKRENLDEAEEYFERALAHLRHVNHRKQMSIICNNMGALNQARGNQERAHDLYQESLTISREEDFPIGQANSLIGLGLLSLKQNQPERAEGYLLDAEKVATGIQSKNLQVEVYIRLTELHEETGNLRKALDYHKKLRGIETEMINAESETRLQRYRILRDSQAARTEEEIHRLRNVELAHANKRLEELVRTKNNFLGIAAHDLKNPIASIRAMAQLILFQGDDITKEEVEEYCQDILSNSDRMLKLVNNLLDLNKIERGHLKVRSTDYNLGEQVQQFAALSQHVANNKNISIKVVVPESPVCVYADRDITIQVLDNLLSNAMKFSDPGTQVQIRVEAHSNGGRFTVVDQGPGIAPKELPLLFGNFSKLSAQPTAGESSTGLGLSIVKQLVNAMDGNIVCESEWGEGASFIVDLPGARQQVV